MTVSTDTLEYGIIFIQWLFYDENGINTSAPEYLDKETACFKDQLRLDMPWHFTSLVKHIIYLIIFLLPPK